MAEEEDVHVALLVQEGRQRRPKETQCSGWVMLRGIFGYYLTKEATHQFPLR